MLPHAASWSCSVSGCWFCSSTVQARSVPPEYGTEEGAHVIAWESSPLVHSPEMSKYSCTSCEPPSRLLAVIRT